MSIGIYKIRNLINNKFYIGSTQIKFSKRKNQHWYLLRKNKHHSKYLQNSWNKHGEENFVFEILEFCSAEKCIIREQYWIDFLKPEYNSNPIANSNKSSKRSIESCEKMKIARNNCNWKITDQGRKKISETHLGISKSKNHIDKVAKANRKKILQFDLENNFIREYECAREAAEINYWKVYTTIYDVCNGKRKSAYKYLWKYAEKRI